MKRRRVDSTNITSIGYDERTKILEIEFNSGSTYQYNNVPVSEYIKLINADSVGKHFHQNIKNNYGFKKL
ncbi:unnamed protein product [marine sediment metagenome]|uniref:KTSC domain-containing protein n=1 Tax=marine sediment metagenome TaxID=412755 RepID=X0UXM1_9ZZZZ